MTGPVLEVSEVIVRVRCRGCGADTHARGFTSGGGINLGGGRVLVDGGGAVDVLRCGCGGFGRGREILLRPAAVVSLEGPGALVEVKGPPPRVAPTVIVAAPRRRSTML